MIGLSEVKNTNPRATTQDWKEYENPSHLNTSDEYSLEEGL